MQHDRLQILFLVALAGLMSAIFLRRFMTRSYYGDMAPVPEKNKKLGDDLVQESIKYTIQKELKQFHGDLQEILSKAKEDSGRAVVKTKAEMKALSVRVHLVEEKIKALNKKDKLSKEAEEQKEKEEVRIKLEARGINVT
jgi:hypothetical protein